MKQKHQKTGILFVLVLGYFYSLASAGYYQDAYKAYKAKNYDEAITILEEGVSAAPNDEKLTFLLGQSYFKAKKYDKALEKFKRTILLDPETDGAYYLMGICYTLKKENGKMKPAWFEASQAFEKAVKLKPNKFSYLYNYGHSLLELKKYSQALEPLKKAMETPKGSKDFKTAMDYGLALLFLKKKDEAIEYLEKAHALNPKKHQPLVYLGNLYLETENYKRVTEIGAQLIALKPDLSTGYIFKGVGELQSKNFSEAKKTFTKATELNPNDASAYYHLGRAMEGMYGKSAKSYQSLIKTYARAINLAKKKVPSEWYYRLGHAYDLESNLDWERAVRNVESRNRCLRNLRKAREYYEKAGEHPSAKKHLATVKERIRQLEVIQ